MGAPEVSHGLRMIQREPGTDGLGSTTSHLVISSRSTLWQSLGFETKHRSRGRVGQRVRSRSTTLESLYPFAFVPDPAWAQTRVQALWVSSRE